MSRPRAIVPVLALLAMATWAIACGDGAMEPTAPPPDPPRPTTVTVTPSTAELTALGETIRFSAEVRDQNGRVLSGVSVAWSSADASVATIDASGLATAVGNGTATITAATGSVQGTARVTVDAPHQAPPYQGTVFLDPDIIAPSDSTDFVDLEPAGRAARLVYDRRPAAWITIEAYLFDATFGSGLTTEFQVNPEFGTWAQAEAAARDYAPAIGQIPAALREDVDAVWIHRGDEAFGGGNRSLLVHTGRGDQYRQQGFLAEVFVHEAVHTSLDSTHADAPGWRAAQAADPTFISTYARDHPDREDLAETFSAWLAVRHRSDRITEGMADTITAAIPNRLAYFDGLDLNLCPVVDGGACGAPARGTLSGTVSHGWADPESGPSVANPGGRVVGAVVEVVDGPDAGRQTSRRAISTYPRWFIMPYQIPDLGTQLHEIGHDFAFATWPEIDAHPWFMEGTAMYFEGGVFAETGSLRVPAPLPYCTDLFRRHDQEGRLVPLGQLLRLAKADFLADNLRTYSQSCMLFDYLERHEPGVLYALIQRINAGRVTSNDELIAALLELTGQTVAELEEVYESHARIARGQGTRDGPGAGSCPIP